MKYTWQAVNISNNDRPHYNYDLIVNGKIIKRFKTLTSLLSYTNKFYN